MRSWIQSMVVACATCVVGSVACSDDDPGTAGVGGQGGAAGRANTGGGAGGSAGRGGAPAAAGAAGQGGRAAGGAGGSAGASGGAAGSAAAGAAGTGGGVGGGEPDAGGGEVDAGGGGDPEPVGFAEAFQVLRDNCAECHGNGGGLPQFAQANQQAAFAVTQNNPGGMFIYDRIIARAVVAQTMPPNCIADDECLTEEEADILQAWVDAGAEE